MADGLSPPVHLSPVCVQPGRHHPVPKAPKIRKSIVEKAGKLYCIRFSSSYRLIVKRKLKKDGQYNIFTQDAYEYRAILTNNTDYTVSEIVSFYNHRGNMEKQFDILKNDFGWNNLPFSKLEQNTVFLYLTAICRNLYNKIIHFFSEKTKTLKPTYRIKNFCFALLLLPQNGFIKPDNII